MRAVQDHLVTGVGVNGRHDAALDGIGVVEGLGHRRQAVGGAGSGGDDGVLSRQGVLIHAVNDGGQVVAGRSGNDDLLGARVDVGLGFGLGSEEAGALQHNVNADLAPGEVRRVFLGQDLDLLAIHGDGSLVGLDGVALVTALRGVIFQQVGKHFRAGEVVDRDDLVTLGAEHLAERQAANAAKAIDCNFYCHISTSSLYSGTVCAAPCGAVFCP